MKWFLLLALAASGCATGSARMMKSNAEGGRVMLIGSNTWMEPNSLKKAELEMSKKCPGGYTVVEEGFMDTPASIQLAGQTHVSEKYIEFKCK